MIKKVGVEWINNYDCHNSLSYENQDAGGFYHELVQHDGWTGSFIWGDSNAWEEDFKRPDKGGTADKWIDTVDFAYFTGHGSPFVAAYFRCDVPDDDRLEADNYSGPDNGDLRLGKNNLEWLAFEVCEALAFDAVKSGINYDVFDRWSKAFQGLHMILSFTTTSNDVATPGRYFAAFCDGRWPSVVFGLPEFLIGRFPLKVIDSWFEMTSCVQPDNVISAVLYANTAGTDTQNDYIHDHGHVSIDPRPGAANWFSWTWISHNC